MINFPNFPQTFLHFPSQGGPPSLRRHFTQTSKLSQTKAGGGQTKLPAGSPECSEPTGNISPQRKAEINQPQSHQAF